MTIICKQSKKIKKIKKDDVQIKIFVKLHLNINRCVKDNENRQNNV